MLMQTKSNITKGLWISYCLLISLFIIYGLLSFYDMRNLSKLTRTIYNHPLVVSNAALKVNVSITKIHRSMKDVVLFDSSLVLDSAIAEIDKQKKHVYKNLAVVNEKVLGKEGRFLSEQAGQLFEDWEPIRSEVIQLVLDGRRTDAAEITLQKGADHVLKLEEKMLELTNYARNKATVFMNDSEKIQLKIKNTSIFFLSMGLLFSFSIAVVSIQRSQSIEKMIKENETNLIQIFDGIPLGIIRVNTAGKFMYVNKKYTQMFGYLLEDIPDSQTWFNIAYKHNEQRQNRMAYWVKALENNTETGVTQTDITCKDGQICSVEVVGTKIGDNHILLLSDITERKKADKEKKKLEVQLQQAQKMESIGTLAGGVAHEINNPINGIMNYAQLILDKMGQEPSLQEYASEIIHETDRVATIVRNLLTFAREENESKSPARIADIVNAVISLIKTITAREQIIIEIEVPDDLPKVKCRSQQIQQVFMNLMTNARDALNERYPEYDENKKIMIYTRLYEKEGRRWICTTVEDHGNGIDPDIQTKIFDPFFTSKPREIGTGLGLSISYGIVKEHHGELTLESKPGEYTKFYIDLPAENGREI